MAKTIYYPGCDEDIPDYLADICDDDYESGRVRGVAFVSTNYIATLKANPTAAATWKAGIQSGDIRIVPEVIGSYDGGSPVEKTGYGDKSTNVTGYNNTLTYKDPTFKTNSAFYNALLRSNNWHIAFRTGSQTQLSDNPVQVTPTNPVTDDITSIVEFNITAKWSQPLMTVPFDTPINIFSPSFATE